MIDLVCHQLRVCDLHRLFVGFCLSPILLIFLELSLFLFLRIASRLIQASWYSSLCSQAFRHPASGSISVLLLLLLDSFPNIAFLLLLSDTLVEMQMSCLKLTLLELQLHLLCDTWYFGSLDLLSFWKTLEEAFVIAYLINCFHHLFLNLGPDVVLIKNEVRRVYVLEQHQLEVPIRWHIHDPSGEFPNSLSLLACHFLWVSIVCMAV